jgi:hypothetical protein
MPFVTKMCISFAATTRCYDTINSNLNHYKIMRRLNDSKKSRRKGVSFRGEIS